MSRRTDVAALRPGGERMVWRGCVGRWVATVALCAAVATWVSAAPARAADGGLDTAFGSNGTLAFNLYPAADDYDASAYGLAVLPDGRILITGTNEDGTSDTARLTTDGRLDPSFGTDGVASLSIAATGDQDLVPNTIVTERDGDVVLGGSAPSGFAYLVRLLPNGQLDRSFGGNGVDVPGQQVSEWGFDLHSAALTPNGSIVLAGTGETADHSYCVMLVEVSADGVPDRSFGDNSQVCYQADTDVPSNSDTWNGDRYTSSAVSVAVQPSGAIDVLGTGLGAPDEGDEFHDYVAQFTPSGALDTSFGNHGIAPITTPGTDGVRGEDLTLAADGDIATVGSAETTAGAYEEVVTRFDSHGQAEPSFGSGGQTVLPTNLDPANAVTGDGLGVRPDGTVVVADVQFGYYPEYPTDVWGLTATGTVDPSFGTGGEQTSAADLPWVSSEPDNSIALGGGLEVSQVQWDFAVTHLLGPGATTSTGTTTGTTATGTTTSAPPSTPGPGTPTSTGPTELPPTALTAPTPPSPPTITPITVSVPTTSVIAPFQRMQLHCTRLGRLGVPDLSSCTITYITVVPGTVSDALVMGDTTLVRASHVVRHAHTRSHVAIRRCLQTGHYRLRLTLRRPHHRAETMTAAVRVP
jgi:uncharacterized delta-60 repeat protein